MYSGQTNPKGRAYQKVFHTIHTIHSDILGPVRITEPKNLYILTIRDYTTRYTILVLVKHKTVNEIINALQLVFSFFSSSNVLVTDNAMEYTAEKNKKKSLKTIIAKKSGNKPLPSSLSGRFRDS